MDKPIKEIRGHDTAELKVKLLELRKEQFELRFRGTSEGPSTARSRNVRRTIARILTVIGDRDRQAGEKN
jgi:ribosomal protein L29